MQQPLYPSLCDRHIVDIFKIRGPAAIKVFSNFAVIGSFSFNTTPIDEQWTYRHVEFPRVDDQ